MKKILLVAVALCTFSYSFSQSYTQGVDEKLQLLDTSEISTHILYDHTSLQEITSISEKKRFIAYRLFKNTTIFVIK